MSDVKVIRVRGTGGAEFDLDDPADDVTARGEVLREQIAKGELVIIEPAAKTARPAKVTADPDAA